MLLKSHRTSRAAVAFTALLTLSACGVLTSSPQDGAAHTASSPALSASQLQSAYDATLLAHRNAGEISSHSLEAKVRSAVRHQQNLAVGDTLSRLSETELRQRLSELDSRLEQYHHASHKGSEFLQLWSLLPALPVLEERKAIKLVLQNATGEPIASSADRAAYLMDLQLNQLFNAFAISVDALTPETEVFEEALVAALNQHGLNMSARRPSLVLQYFIEMYDTDEGKEVVGDFELKDRSAKLFQSLSTELKTRASETASAESVAIEQIADEITRLMLTKALERISAVNQYK